MRQNKTRPKCTIFWARK